MEQQPKAVQQQQDTPRRKVVWGVLYFVIYLLASLAATVGFLLFCVWPQLMGGDFQALQAAVRQAVSDKAMLLSLITNLTVLAALGTAILWRGKPLEGELWMQTPAKRVWPLWLLGMSLNALFTALLTLAPAALLDSYEAAASVLSNSTGFGALLAVAVLAPLTEEIVFRGLLYRGLSAGLPKWLAVLLTSVAFGLLHGQALWMAYAFLMGLVLCLACDWYDSLWGSILLHVAFNLSGGATAALMEALPVWAVVGMGALVSAGTMVYIKRMGPGEKPKS